MSFLRIKHKKLYSKDCLSNHFCCQLFSSFIIIILYLDFPFIAFHSFLFLFSFPLFNYFLFPLMNNFNSKDYISTWVIDFINDSIFSPFLSFFSVVYSNFRSRNLSTHFKTFSVSPATNSEKKLEFLTLYR